MAVFIPWRSADTDFDAGNIFCSQGLDYRSDTIVPTGSATGNNFYPGKRQVKVVVDNNYVFPGDFEELNKCGHTVAGPVHIGHRFDKTYLVTE